MVKYVEDMTSIVFEEIPDKVSLAVNISNCQNRCKGCHSPFLIKNIGEELTFDTIDKLMSKNKGVNCFLFLGEGNDRDMLLKLNDYLKENYNIHTALYSGRDKVEDELFDKFDYVKVGSYKEECGPLNNKNTNQKLFYHRKDITNKFWRN